MNQRFTQSPDPAVPGDTVTFCYDVDDVSLPVLIRGAFSPNGPAFEHTVTSKDDRCFEVKVPKDAEGGVVSGEDTDDFAIAVAP